MLAPAPARAWPDTSGRLGCEFSSSSSRRPGSTSPPRRWGEPGGASSPSEILPCPVYARSRTRALVGRCGKYCTAARPLHSLLTNNFKKHFLKRFSLAIFSNVTKNIIETHTCIRRQGYIEGDFSVVKVQPQSVPLSLLLNLCVKKELVRIYL